MNLKKFLSGFILLILITGAVPQVYSSPIFEYAATPSTEIPLTGGISSSLPKVAVNSGETFVVWQESTPGIGFSWTGDLNYATGIYAYLDDPLAISSNPQIVVISPTEIYVSAVVDNTADGLGIGAGYYISVTKISDPTYNAGSVIGQDWTHYVLVDASSPPDEYRLSAMNGEAFVTWRLSTNIKSAFDTGSGLTASSSNPIATGSVSNIDSVIFGAGPYVVVTYDKNTATELDVFSVYSSDGGYTFSSPFNISSSIGVDSFDPAVATDGTDVFVAWEEGTGSSKEIYFSQNSTTYSTPISLSSNSGSSDNPVIAADSSHIFVAWEDYVTGSASTRDILFTNSPDGSTFATPTNLSSDSKESLNPDIATDGSTAINVAWLDYTFDNTNGDILIRSSNDNGDSFGGIQILTEDSVSGTYPDPVFDISSDSTVVGAAWSQPFDDEIYMKNGLVTGIDVLLDNVEYTSDSATLTIRNSTANTNAVSVDTISPKITNISTPSTSTDQILTETGVNTGVFSGTVLLSAVNAAPGDKIQVDSYNETTSNSLFSTFAILPSDVSIRFNPADSVLERGNIYGFTVVDSAANLDSGVLDTVTATVKSNANPTGIPITLTETGPATGVFSGTANIAFMNGDYTPTLSDTVTITQTNSTGLNNDAVVQAYRQSLSSTSAGPITITLTETSAASNTYSGTINFCSTSGCSSASTNTIEAAAGDFFTISSISGVIKTNGIIDPDSTTNSRGAIQVSCTVGNCGNAIAQYTPSSGPTVSTTVQIQDTYAPGGGGGGISRAGLVVQAVGAIALFGGGGSSNSGPPSFDDSSFTLSKGIGGVLSDSTSKLEVGQKSDISMGFKLPGGLHDLDHIGLYANIGPGQDKYDTDTYIYFDQFKTPQITIHDPHGFFKSVNVNVKEPSKTNIDVNFVFDFAKSLDSSNVVFEAWTLGKDSALKEIPGLLQVTDKTQPETTQDTQITPAVQEEQRPPVPEWVKSNAAWWGEGQIDDGTFTNGIGFLIQNHIIDVHVDSTNISPDPTSDQPQKEFVPIVPAWVKNNALWWSENQLTDDEFLTAIKYLVEKGIIQVRV